MLTVDKVPRRQRSKQRSFWTAECFISKLFRLDHLNQDEYEHVEKLIKNNADRFQITWEPLVATNILQHSFPTVDDSPLFPRQYSFTPVYKEEITRRVDGLLKNNIIKYSQSAHNTLVWIVPKKTHFSRENKMEKGS